MKLPNPKDFINADQKQANEILIQISKQPYGVKKHKDHITIKTSGLFDDESILKIVYDKLISQGWSTVSSKINSHNCSDSHRSWSDTTFHLYF